MPITRGTPITVSRVADAYGHFATSQGVDREGVWNATRDGATSSVGRAVAGLIGKRTPRFSTGALCIQILCRMPTSEYIQTSSVHSVPSEVVENT